MLSDQVQTTTLTEDVKNVAIAAGFVSVGITNVETLSDLPYGWVGELRELYRPEEELPSVKSVIVMAFSISDQGYFLNILNPDWSNNGTQPESARPRHNSYVYEVMKNKAWRVVEYLREAGFEAKWSVGIPLKTTAVLCGLGSQGKSSLLVTPSHGPRVNLIAVLTSAESDPDSPFEEDLCGECERCIRVCPTKAIVPYRPRINHCMVYPLDCPDSTEVPKSVKEKTKRLIKRPTPNSYIECARCIDACPIGRPSGQGAFRDS